MCAQNRGAHKWGRSQSDGTARSFFWRRTMFNRQVWVGVLGAAMAIPAVAQFKNGSQSTALDLPEVSQKAMVSQRLGVTDITITYHRPLAKDRKVFGTVVPYGQVWRAGANENTTIEFSDPVSIEGKSLDAGKYGLHMIPNEDYWTVIFSKANSAWGSF